MDITVYLKEKKGLVDAFLHSYFSSPITQKRLQDSMVYSLSAGGKRIRPVLCLAAYEACGGEAEEVLPWAAALEFIHTYSLIHDDLPAMDNDDLRRGKPTNHKVFGEGMAILAGDGLLTEAFALLSGFSVRSPRITDRAVLRVIHEIAQAAGLQGMVGGQAQDLLSEDAEPDAETLSYIHIHKTAALIAASVRVGGILASCAEEHLLGLTGYGSPIGLAFQVVDDILDVEGETEVLGKPRGSDEKKKKMTYPKLYGLEKSKEKARELVDRAIGSLEIFDEKAEPLRAIARYLLERKS
ncbi:MAG: polyprenyl synthetase family protein [Alphaproteobacteria bacterium]|uniref:Polyprenyl synthetase family protein n=1 Tax=Candidatus Nitrobium versatile TaxID=2884831 RepID=A0A953M2E6_9BACT|nr:polyprenyl synthetase family protein [Candidatus Nitrobium versatile]